MSDSVIERDQENNQDLGPKIVTEFNRRAAVVLGVSIVIASVIPQLLKLEHSGLGYSLTVFLIVGVVFCLSFLFNRGLKASTQWILLAVACLGATFALRSSMVLVVFSCVGLIVATALLLSSRYSRSYSLVAMSSWLFTPVYLLKYTLYSCFRLVRLSQLHRLIVLGDISQLRSILFGLLFSIPFIYIFGVLLTSSDPRFNLFVRSIFSWDLGRGIEHLVQPLLYWPIVVACLFSSVKHTRVRASVVGNNLRMNGVQINVILFCVNFLFLSYILVQFSYFFGGDQLVTSTRGLTYASYAKGGFWELVWVALISLPLLVVAHWLQRDELNGVRRWFLLLSSVMILAVIILEFSAVHRMVLYIQAYGITQLRFYASAFMIFIVVALIGFYLTVLKGKRGAYVALLSASAVLIIIVLNVINPSALIANYNLKQSTSSRLDVRYLLNLGADAYPAIIEYKMLNPSTTDCRLQKQMRNRLYAPESWLEWNYAQKRALKALERWRSSHKCPQQ